MPAKTPIVQLALILALGTGLLWGQNKPIYRQVQVSDYGSGTALRDVYVKMGKQAQFTDALGKVTFKLNARHTYTLAIHYLGYHDTAFAVRPDTVPVLKVALRPRSEVLTEAEVVAQPVNTAADALANEIMQVTVRYKDLKSTAMAFGDMDIVKGLLHESGVQAGMPGGSDIYVRGGDVYHNAMLLEGVPLLNINHGFGYFSPFAAGGIESMQFYKQGFPGRYGNNLASVMDVRLRKASGRRIAGNFALGPASLRGSLGIPLRKDTSGLFISGRLFTLGLGREIAKLFTDDASEQNFFNFQDASLKWHRKINENATVEAFGYWSGDQINFSSRPRFFTYDNTPRVSSFAGGLRWLQHRENLYQTHQIYTSRYKFQFDRELQAASRPLGAEQDSLFENQNQLWLMGYKNEWNWEWLQTRWKAGSDWRVYYQQLPRFSEVRTANKVVNFGGGSEWRFTPALYADVERDVTPKLKLKGGLRLEHYAPSKRSNIIALPHVSAHYALYKHWALFAAYDRTANLVHRYRNLSYGNPFDIPAMANNKLPYSTVSQTSAGVVYLKNSLRINASLFYKNLNQVVDRDYNQPLIMYHPSFAGKPTEDIREGLLSVNGESYGLETDLRYQWHIFRFSLAYTWSKSQRQAGFLNRGQPYPFEFNRRHLINAQFNVRFKRNAINKITELGLGYTYGSGNFSQFAIQDQINPLWDAEGGFPFIDKRNNVRLPALSHLDFLVNFIHEKDNGNVRIFSISVFNVLATPLVTQFEDKRFGRNGQVIGTQSSGPFAVIPSINYELRF